MTDNVFNIYDDNGNQIDPTSIPKPEFCRTCRKDEDANEFELCTLNRFDQKDSRKFICDEYEPADPYEDYESESSKIKDENRILLGEFRKYLENKKLSVKTVKKHVFNIEFYINDFLLYSESQKPEEGIGQLDYFLGFWFVRKALWSTESSVKEYIASLKHFYTFMQLKGKVTSEDLDEMKQEIKEYKNEWIENVKDY